jgi:fructose-bisphosphate aldolase class I
MNTDQLEKVKTATGFFAALDQSGGSTPGALAEYGISRDRYANDAEMFDFVHALRTRVYTSPAFGGDRVIASILFKQTMEREVDGLPTARYLWERKNVVPILKVDLGLADENDGVQLMKPIDTLVEQQFGYAGRIRAAGLVPILEPEVSITSPHKEQAEALLNDAIHKHVEALPADAMIMVKVSIPTRPGLYADLASDPRVLRVLALSGGYSRDEACALLVHDHAMIASFSRALLEGLTDGQTDDQFNAQLNASIAQIYQASVDKE